MYSETKEQKLYIKTYWSPTFCKSAGVVKKDSALTGLPSQQICC